MPEASCSGHTIDWNASSNRSVVGRCIRAIGEQTVGRVPRIRADWILGSRIGSIGLAEDDEQEADDDCANYFSPQSCCTFEIRVPTL